MRSVQPLWDLLCLHHRALLGVTILLLVGILLGLFSSDLQQLFRDLFRSQNRSTPFFYLTFLGLLVLAFLTNVFPASIFGILAGMMFGLFKGFAICGVAILVAALIAFVFARYFFYAASRRIAAKVLDLNRLEARLSKHGLRYAFLIRSAPIAPFSITSYGLSLMPIRFIDYLLTTVATFPFLFACVYIGSVGGFLVSMRGEIVRPTIWWLALIFSAVTLILALFTYFLPRLARWVLRLGPDSI